MSKRRPDLSQPPTDDDLVASINDSLFVSFFVFALRKLPLSARLVGFAMGHACMHGRWVPAKKVHCVAPRDAGRVRHCPTLHSRAPCASKFERSFGADLFGFYDEASPCTHHLERRRPESIRAFGQSMEGRG
jgi:hypothetical protein